jgi:hypothetical protein
MRTTCHLLLTAALLAPSVALAGGADATLVVDNRFDGEAEVWVDGRFEGLARPNATTAFDVQPGLDRVVISRPGTHYELAKATLVVAPRQAVEIPVLAPTATLRIDNKGDVALKLDLGASDVWVQPGASALVPIKAGNVTFGASIHDPRGDFRAIDRTVWVEPGQLATTVLEPDPTMIVVTNREAVPVRALLDGADAGWIQPGETQRVWVRPGATNLVLVDRLGRVISTRSVFVGKGDEQKVVVAAPAPPVLVVRF